MYAMRNLLEHFRYVSLSQFESLFPHRQPRLNFGEMRLPILH